MSDLLRGSQWNRWDLHFHTPSSYEYVDNSVSNSDIVEGLVAASVRVVAITDHHVIDVSRVKKLQEIGQGRLTVLPGIELRTDQGGQPIHYICIFPENCNLDHVWTTFQGKLGLTSVEIERKGGNDRIYVPIAKAAPVTQELGGIITIHAGTKTNSIENIKNSEQFLMRIKFDITKDFVHFMEIGQIKDINDHINIIFPKTGLDKPLILCSDNHNIRSYSPKANMWICADPTFKGLQMVIQEPRDRVFIGDRPPALARVEQNKTKYIRRVSFSRKDGSTNGGWFSGGIDFNHGLVAIVGNKGSGKSALADTLGLLGSTKKGDSFSFLCDSRFRHAMNGYANLYEATLEWESGETVRKSLADKVSPDEVERVKYLPQDHVEKVCNEIAGGGEVGFDKELQAVIFSHVPETERLGLKSLEELVQFKSGEKQKRIDTLQKQLRELGRSRAALEDKKNPAVRRELEEKVKRKQAELSSHEQTKPQEVQNPMEAGVGPAGDPQLLKGIRIFLWGRGG